MNLHEYQAKNLIKSYGVPIQEGDVAETPEGAYEIAKRLYEDPEGKFFVIKAQIHAGGRGKAGGVKLARGLENVKGVAAEILGKTLVTHQTGPEGKLVRIVLVAEDVYYPGPSELKEYYLSVTLDREKGKDVFVGSAEGGVNIEDVARDTPEKIVKEWVDPTVGIQPFQARKIAFQLGFEGQAFKHAVNFIQQIYAAYKGSDAALLEINPMLKTSDDKVIAVDCKMRLEDSSLFRHPDLTALRDLSEEDPLEVEAGEHGLTYITLDGDVGCMVNGAGLAMATMDMIKLNGGEPANFLDVGGKASAETVEEGFRIILKDPKVKAILVNIFGGIVRCDRVANGVVEAYKNIGNIDVPIIVRLQGTNAEEAARIIDESGLKVTSAITLADAAARVREALS